MPNQTGIVGNPYSGGNVVLNQTPFANFYVNTLARQQAQRDAFAKSMQEQGKGLTPAGMRGQDVGALMDAKNKWQAHWLQNKDNIQHPDRDNGEAWAENNRLYNEAATVPIKSKEDANVDKALLKLSLDPTRAARISDDARGLIHQHQLPINDPNHKSLTLDDLDGDLFNPKRMTIENKNALGKTLETQFPGVEDESQKVTGDLKPNYERNITSVNIPNDKTNEKDRLLAMGKQMYQNGMLKGDVDDIINNHKKDGNGLNNPIYDHYNNVIKQHFGHDIDILHPEELSTAMLMDMNPAYQPKTKSVLDWDARNKANDETLRIREADNRKAQFENAKKLASYKLSISEAKDAEKGNMSHQFIQKMTNDAIADPNNKLTFDNNGTPQTLYKIPLSPDQLKIFSKQQGTLTKQPDAMMTDGTNYVPTFYKGGKDKNGSPVIDRELSTPLPPAQYEMSLGKHLFGDAINYKNATQNFLDKVVNGVKNGLGIGGNKNSTNSGSGVKWKS